MVSDVSGAYETPVKINQDAKFLKQFDEVKYITVSHIHTFKTK